MIAAMDSGILIAVIVGAMAVLGQQLQSRSASKARREDKEEDWARQDAVASQAAKAAELLLAQNKVVAETATTTNEKLDVIHTLVNSNMTAAMQAEYDATVRELAMMREVIRLNKVAGTEPSVEATAAVDATEIKVGELKATLEDRLRQAQVVEKQIAAQPQGAVGKE